MKYKMVSFDMDGTLTRGTTCLQYYISKLGQEKRAEELEHLYRTHTLDDSDVADEYAKILKGVSQVQLIRWTGDIPRMKNIAEAVTRLKTTGLTVGITSVGPLFASQYFRQYFDFDFTSGSEHSFVDGRHAGKMIRTLTGADKIAILEKICREKGLKLSEVVAVGDSRSDIPIFQKVGLRIALNADENLKEATDIFLQTGDLLVVADEIIKHLS